MRIFMVLNGCSEVSRRVRIACGFWAARRGDEIRRRWFPLSAPDGENPTPDASGSSTRDDDANAQIGLAPPRKSA